MAATPASYSDVHNRGIRRLAARWQALCTFSYEVGRGPGTPMTHTEAARRC